MSLEYAREVLDAEIAALQLVRSRLDEKFEQALDLIIASSGRIVSCGMGKAGMIAKKVAATMASTGTHSFYLHPAEALHGDLGMVNRDDVCLIFSNSGESDEVSHLLPGIRAIGAKIVAVTGNERSTLAVQSDVVILMGKIEEACPLGLAPSATTTAMLAVGDAVALCLMKRKDFKIEDYALYHPAGALGKKSSPVANIMRKGDNVAVVSPQTTVADTLLAITHARSGAAVVCDEAEHVKGIFCDGDLRRGLEKDQQMMGKPVAEFMTAGCRTVTSDTVAGLVLEMMREKRIGEIPVVDADNKLAGMADLKGMLASL